MYPTTQHRMPAGTRWISFLFRRPPEGGAGAQLSHRSAKRGGWRACARGEVLYEYHHYLFLPMKRGGS
nr:hypothetical protein [Cressdnaviricota sp.]